MLPTLTSWLSHGHHLWSSASAGAALLKGHSQLGDSAMALPALIHEGAQVGVTQFWGQIDTGLRTSQDMLLLEGCWNPRHCVWPAGISNMMAGRGPTSFLSAVRALVQKTRIRRVPTWPSRRSTCPNNLTILGCCLASAPKAEHCPVGAVSPFQEHNSSLSWVLLLPCVATLKPMCGYKGAFGIPHRFQGI